MRAESKLGGLAAAVLALGVVSLPTAAQAQLAACGGIVDNGTIQMGINCEGHLNFPFEPDPLGIGFMGLRYLPTGAASTEPGCQCEGWGVADPLSGVSGYANVSSDNGVNNIQLLSFEVTANTAVSTVQVGSTFRVVHDYHPSPVTPYLYEVTVTVTNISTAPTNALYRRVMDWDVYPTPFDEFVTIVVGNAQELYRTDTNGFNSANPFSFSTYESGPVEDAGPNDHGALFDFDFGILQPNESKTFRTYYGAAGDEATALNALARVAAEAFSLGQPNVEGGPNLGIPNTFVFAFSGIGGSTALCSEVTPPPSCTETDPCVSLRNRDVCPADATEVVDTTTLQVCPPGFEAGATECPPPAGALCPGEQLGIVRTHSGRFTEVVTDTDLVCHDSCTERCGQRCTAVPAQHCYSTCIRRCTNGACLEWGTRCDAEGTATECNDACFEQCSANWSSQTVSSYFTAECGYSFTDETVEIRAADGACGGAIVATRELSGAGTAATNVAMPLEPGLYDVCLEGALLQQVTVGSCNDAPACSVSVPSNRWIVAQGSPAATLPVTLSANAFGGGEYSLSLVRYYDDTHTTFLPLPGCTSDVPGCSWLSIASPSTVGASGSANVDLLALNPQPTGAQILWPGTVIRAEGPDANADGAPDVVCETSVLVGLQCQMDADCDDGDLCTTDACDPTNREADLRGCVTAPTCAVGDLCLQALCNPMDGSCSIIPVPDGDPCTDGSACTVYDHCIAGSCTPGQPAECTALDGCHEASCDPAVGCVNTALPDGTTCDDADLCTTSDLCLAGTCVGASPLTCVADQCNTGVCDPAIGCVEQPAGTTCDDGNLCTARDTCVGGACVGSNPTGDSAVCVEGLSGSGTAGGSGAICFETYTFLAVAGQTYTISTCGASDGDTYLSVSGVCTCSNDDFCDVGSQCECTATADGVVTIC
ncbi:hypothetical protein L6R52_36675, partial [Myxococcota bacterium]|nr:hypothetical protein [Myxococcota bacterium]